MSCGGAESPVAAREINVPRRAEGPVAAREINVVRRG
jgi:hypothetical protein